MAENITKEMIRDPKNLVYKKSALMTDKPLSYCPGCGHGTAHRLIMEVVEEMGIQSDTIGIAPVGCSVLAYEFLDVDMQQAAHGRAPALATAVTRLFPEKYVFTYQGDGDLAAIGTAETIHACNRGENIVIIFINNGIYGMTGGQMAPTTLPGMKTSTSPYGREVEMMGNPLKITELVAQLPGTYYVTRQAVHKPANVRRAKKAIRKAFEYTRHRKGLCLVEIVSNCNSGWKMTPIHSNEWMEQNMFPYYPLGDIKTPEESAK
jgi:2-oxoglutarate/2-oxoacid ferredoxin oxidoreductase subunit beta